MLYVLIDLNRQFVGGTPNLKFKFEIHIVNYLVSSETQGK